MSSMIARDKATTLEVITSPKASKEDAFKAEEFILFPMVRLKLESQIFINMDISIKAKGTVSNITSEGFIILLKEDLTNWIPTNITIKETSKAEIYSTLPWPKGCSSSAGALDSLKPIMVMSEEALSVKLLKASAVIAMLLVKIPAASFIIKRIMFATIPTIPASNPKSDRTLSLFISSLSLMKVFINILVNIVSRPFIILLFNYIILVYHKCYIIYFLNIGASINQIENMLKSFWIYK